MINNYSELNVIAKIAYSRFKSGAITLAQLESLVPLKISQDEFDFITGGV